MYNEHFCREEGEYMFLCTIKPIDLSDLPALMIASEESDLIRIPGLHYQQLSEGVIASVNNVSL